MASTDTHGEPTTQATSRNGGSTDQQTLQDLDRRARGRHGKQNSNPLAPDSISIETSSGNEMKKLPKWNMGMLNFRETDEVPGSILLLPETSEYNEPLGLRNTPARTSASSLPSWNRPYPPSRRSSYHVPDKKRTADGKIILEPQPDDSLNDPLNWTIWRRDAALFSLGFYCMLGGGMTTALAAGFGQVATDYGVSVPRVALTTGLYMMGLGLGSVVLSPTAILFGKRPVYLAAAICFAISAVWCAVSPNFPSLVCARIFQGFAVSSVECLPSASIAEIYFLHEKAYRLGVYTLLLLGGKNLIPLVSAAIIGGLNWRWVFWVVAIVVAFAAALLFFFVPETFWDRTPTPPPRRTLPSRPSFTRRLTLGRTKSHTIVPHDHLPDSEKALPSAADADVPAASPLPARHAHFTAEPISDEEKSKIDSSSDEILPQSCPTVDPQPASPSAQEDYFTFPTSPQVRQTQSGNDPAVLPPPTSSHKDGDTNSAVAPAGPNAYTRHFQSQPPKTWAQQLRPWSGRLSHDRWLRVAVRPFILFAYPSILWSALVYALSVGWLIVLSESVSTIYEQRATYNFTALQAGLVYISPFVGGILGTAVAGKFSDVIVRALARRNGGLYEPEFRLVMGVPIAVFTTIGLMGYGWAAQERDAWIVPTVFFGFISFGCCVGSTTAITFAVDSYRQYAGEALVTLNFSKNILHGLVFSLFFNRWLEAAGSKDVFIAIGGIQLACLLTTIPMYIYGKRARMWTARKGLMEKF